eukprot:5326843-Pleurochrysis_carterae.AAC.2
MGPVALAETSIQNTRYWTGDDVAPSLSSPSCLPTVPLPAASARALSPSARAWARACTLMRCTRVSQCLCARPRSLRLYVRVSLALRGALRAHPPSRARHVSRDVRLRPAREYTQTLPASLTS